MSSRAQVFTADHLLKTLQSFPAANAYIVGFSGGADSTALLHALCTIRQQLNTPVSAVHVNHGIHPNADTWQQQCKTFCRSLGIDLTCLGVELKNVSGKGQEAEARHLRYEAITALLSPGDCLLTAHHADDQAETMLLNLMRGSGVDGLTAMPASRSLEHGLLQRPLLYFSNKALMDYLHENSIDWSEDPSNQHLNHDRNFVRHEVIPLLEKRWPKVSQRLLLTQFAMTDARRLLETLADDYIDPNLGHPFVLHITPDCLSNLELIKLVIRRWLKKTDTPAISAHKLNTFCEQIRLSGSDQKVLVQWDGWMLRWYKHYLWLQTDDEIQPCPEVTWPRGEAKVELGTDVGQLEFITKGQVMTGTGQHACASLGIELTVGSRLQSPDANISLGGHHRRLKHLFQAAAIPPWLRNSIPLSRLDGELVAIGDWCFNEAFSARMSEHGIALNWHPEHPLLQFILKQQHGLNH